MTVLTTLAVNKKKKKKKKKKNYFAFCLYEQLKLLKTVNPFHNILGLF